MEVPDFLKSTQEMLFRAFPNGISEEYYWGLLYLLYDYIADENLALVMSTIIEKPKGVIESDIYKVCQLQLDEKVIVLLHMLLKYGDGICRNQQNFLFC